MRVGLTRAAIDHRLKVGRLAIVLPGVYALPGATNSIKQKLWAGHLWLGDESAISHRAAAARWGFEGFTSHPIELSTMRWKRTGGVKLPDGAPLVIHRVDHHLRNEIVHLDGLSVTSTRRTLLDLCGKKDPKADRVLDQGLRNKLIAIPELWLYLEQEWMRGRRGVRILRNLLVDRTPGQAPNDSALESELRTLMIRRGLPAPVHQHEVAIPQATIHIDLAYPDAMLAIEVDSYSWHMDRQAFERDRERDNELSLLGWTVLRFTWAMIRYERDRVIALIGEHLASSVQKARQ